MAPDQNTISNGTAAVDINLTMWNEDMFEGDLKIPEKLIMDYYNFKDIPGGDEISLNISNNARSKRSNERFNKRAAGSKIRLWENAIVPYTISRNMPAEAAMNISTAMKVFETNTCLRFRTVNGARNYVKFTKKDKGCYSTFIGRRNGRQIINLGSPGCYTVPVILHEIAHAIGFWHEQSRPDRDSYVTVHWNNIERKSSGFYQFLKRKDYSIDYQGSEYDYSSIMHYPEQAFSKSNCRGKGCITMSVRNPTVYVSQGSPVLGKASTLSREDIVQTNRLYSCPQPGIRGLLIIVIRYGISMRDTDGWLNNPDPYVSLKAIDSQGSSYTFKTPVAGGTRNPVWNEVVVLGERNWQFFRISSWDEDWGKDDQLTMSETIQVSPGNHRSVKHCENQACAGYIIFDYYLYTNTREIARLTVKIRFARHLRDTDPIWNKPDPYVQVEGYNVVTEPDRRRSNIVSGTTHPTWNEIIDYGCNRWSLMTLQVKDNDGRSSDLMSDKHWIQLNTGYYYYHRREAYDRGYFIFDYALTIDRDDCSPNPCRNGGSCVDKCTGYLCKCRRGFLGTTCQHLAGNLRLTARYGRNLPDSDGLWNDSDPYMEFVAVDVFGKTKRKNSRSVGGNHNPEWNQVLDFGYGAWKSIKIRVHDSDWGSDDALSAEQTVKVTKYRYSTNLRHQCYSGYTIFDLNFH